MNGRSERGRRCSGSWLGPHSTKNNTVTGRTSIRKDREESWNDRTCNDFRRVLALKLRTWSATYMKVERWVDGLGGCHDSLGDNLTSIDTYQIVTTNQLRAHDSCTRVAHLSFPKDAANPRTGRGWHQGTQCRTTRPNLSSALTVSNPKYCHALWRPRADPRG